MPHAPLKKIPGTAYGAPNRSVDHNIFSKTFIVFENFFLQIAGEMAPFTIIFSKFTGRLTPDSLCCSGAYGICATRSAPLFLVILIPSLQEDPPSRNRWFLRGRDSARNTDILEPGAFRYRLKTIVFFHCENLRL